MYTVDTYYSYVIDSDETVDIYIYLNKKHPLVSVDSYMESYIYNEDNSKQISLNIKDIKMIHYSELYKLNFYSLKSASTILNLSKEEVLKLGESGEIKIEKIYKNYNVPVNSLMEYLKNKGE